ncbi:hypothetical protein A9G22_10015 [Gilliamella sp. App2-1]|nr:hypothetical protein A9G22_10015 [Gilliamella apicola]
MIVKNLLSACKKYLFKYNYKQFILIIEIVGMNNNKLFLCLFINFSKKAPYAIWSNFNNFALLLHLKNLASNL